MGKNKAKHLFTKAGDPIIHASHHSYIFDQNASKALIELNQVILHLDRLISCCTGFAESDIEAFFDLDLSDTLFRFQDLRDSEFGDYVNWNTIAKAIGSNN